MVKKIDEKRGNNEKPEDSPNFIDAINTIADRAEPVMKIIETFSHQYVTAKEVKIKFNLKMAWLVTITYYYNNLYRSDFNVS